MMNHDLILTFAGGLGAALIMGYIAQRIRVSPIVGYLMAGIIIGPYTPGYVADRHLAEQCAEIGVILLMFGVGLRFHLHELLAVWRVAVPGAVVQSIASTVMAAVALRFMGWEWPAAVVFGLAISVASTVVLVRVMTEHRDLHTTTGHIAVGWVVVEDLLTIAILVALPVLFGPGAGADGDSITWAMLLAMAKLAACVGLVVVIGGRVIPWLLGHVAETKSRELFTLSILAVALGIAVTAAYAFGVSMALGAFLAGLVVGRSDFAARAAGDALPMRDAFAVLFFISVGMLFDPSHLLSAPFMVAAMLAVVIIGKPLAAIAVIRAVGRPASIAWPVGVALGQVGEFTFILGTTARGLGILDDGAWNTLVAVSILSIVVNPTCYRFSRRVGKARPAPALAVDSARAAIPRADGTVATDGAAVAATAAAVGQGETEAEAALEGERCIVVGYGPVGQQVVRVLAEQGVAVTVVEMNLATMRALRVAGIAAVYGDAARIDTLIDAGIDRASTLVISTDLDDAAEAVRAAIARRPGLRILIRCAHLRDVPALRQAGAEIVIAGEGEIAVSLAAAVLHQSGADPATVSGFRRSARAELSPAPVAPER